MATSRRSGISRRTSSSRAACRALSVIRKLTCGIEPVKGVDGLELHHSRRREAGHVSGAHSAGQGLGGGGPRGLGGVGRRQIDRLRRIPRAFRAVGQVIDEVVAEDRDGLEEQVTELRLDVHAQDVLDALLGGAFDHDDLDPIRGRVAPAPGEVDPNGLGRLLDAEMGAVVTERFRPIGHAVGNVLGRKPSHGGGGQEEQDGKGRPRHGRHRDLAFGTEWEPAGPREALGAVHGRRPDTGLRTSSEPSHPLEHERGFGGRIPLPPFLCLPCSWAKEWRQRNRDLPR